MTFAAKTAAALLAATLIAGAAPAAAQSAPNGATIYKQRCQVCHGAPGKTMPTGPSLTGVVGRKAAATPFKYSPALTNSKLVWTRANLDKFLAAPSKLVPGTRMVIALPDAAQRKAVLDYLATLRP